MYEPKFKVGDVLVSKRYLRDKIKIINVIGIRYVYVPIITDKVTGIETESRFQFKGFPEFIDKAYIPYNQEPTQQTLPIQPKCTHPRKYHNKVLTTFMIWVCPDCKQEV